MGKIFPILFLAYMCSFINTLELEVNGRVGHVIQHISEFLTDANNFYLILLEELTLK